MPTISQIIDKKKGNKKSFVKKEYRPYKMDKDTRAAEDATQVEKGGSTDSEAAGDALVNCELTGAQGNNLSDPEGQEVKALSGNIDISTILEGNEKLNSASNKQNFPVNEEFLTTLETSTEDVLTQLSGRQKELLVLIIGNLLDNNSLLTSPIQAKKLTDNLGASLGTVKNTVRRLEAKGLIKSISKRGRGGFYRFQSTEKVISVGQRLFFRP